MKKLLLILLLVLPMLAQAETGYVSYRTDGVLYLEHSPCPNLREGDYQAYLVKPNNLVSFGCWKYHPLMNKFLVRIVLTDYVFDPSEFQLLDTNPKKVKQ